MTTKGPEPSSPRMGTNIKWNVGDLVKYTQTSQHDNIIELIGEVRKIDVEMNRFSLQEYNFPWIPKSIASIYWVNGDRITRLLSKDEVIEVKKQILIDTQILEYE